MKYFLLLLLIILSYFIWKHFNKQKRELITTQDVDKYLKIVEKLQAANIKYKTSSGGEEFNFHKNVLDSDTPPVSYIIWVDESNFYKAQQLLKQK